MTIESDSTITYAAGSCIVLKLVSIWNIKLFRNIIDESSIFMNWLTAAASAVVKLLEMSEVKATEKVYIFFFTNEKTYTKK